jgi:putative ABC transport system ATP-binding protein
MIQPPVIEATQLQYHFTSHDVDNRNTLNQPRLIHILKALNLTINAGEQLAIIGSSGSGKSTLLSLLAGLEVPTQGSVQINGKPFSVLDEDGRAAVRSQTMGFVFQSFQLLPSLTALENVMLPLQLKNHPQAKALSLNALERVGLGARVQHYPKQLSGGEQQRVAIARAFVTEPAILFADEPTGNLDHATGQMIIDLLFEMNLQKGTTLVLVTHDSQLAKRCHRQLKLVDGALVVLDAS